MILRACAFTDRGARLAERLEAAFPEDVVERRPRTQTLRDWVGESFADNMPLVFIGACGIAVRAIAPFVKDKTLDSPVVVVDELGRFAIPILSGHLGGANRLAETLAARLGAAPVITTATDVNALFAVDVFAAENALSVEDRDGIAAVSAKLLREGRIDVAVDPGIAVLPESAPGELRLRAFPPDSRVDVVITEDPRYRGDAALWLAPKPYVLGVGCRKGTPCDAIAAFVSEQTRALGLPDDAWKRVAAVASVDLKQREYGLVRFAARIRAPFMTFSADELAAVPGEFASSAFVRETTGVDCVCERAAALCAGPGYELILRKRIGDGVTLAVAKRKAVVETWKKRSIS